MRYNSNDMSAFNLVSNTSRPATSRRRLLNWWMVWSRVSAADVAGRDGVGQNLLLWRISSLELMCRLVLAHNKFLAAQLFSEFKEFFPDNGALFC